MWVHMVSGGGEGGGRVKSRNRAQAGNGPHTKLRVIWTSSLVDIEFKRCYERRWLSTDYRTLLLLKV